MFVDKMVLDQVVNHKMAVDKMVFDKMERGGKTKAS
jgi:hypothetical protein